MYKRPTIFLFLTYIILFTISAKDNAFAQKIKVEKNSTKNEYTHFAIESQSKDSSYAHKISTVWLKKAKSENNWTQAAAAYRSLIYISANKQQLLYADSVITAAKKSKDNLLIGNAYLTKGVLFYNNKNSSKALDNYILANEYIAKTDDLYTIHKVKYSIAHTKYYLGFYDEAIALFTECVKYFEEENETAYLNSLHSLGLCYNKIGNYDSCSHYNLLGIQAGVEFENYEMEPYFRHSEGINKYFKGQYNACINQLNDVLPEIEKKKDFANETVALFYIGKSYLKINNQEKAVQYFIKVDNSFTKHNYIRPDLRENYELLINYYNKKKNPILKLIYIDRLLKVDSVLNHNYRYLSKKIFKEYDTKKLLQEKSELQQKSTKTAKILYILISILIVVIIILYHRQYSNQIRYKKRFEELMFNKNNTIVENQKVESQIIDFDINDDLTTSLLSNLEKFERNKKYIEKDMNLSKVALYLDTNIKYASKIIQKYRNKGFRDYIADLKIDYIITKLESENKYRNYTNKALAEEAGFGSTQNFTKAFNKKSGMPPTFFITELKKSFPL